MTTSGYSGASTHRDIGGTGSEETGAKEQARAAASTATDEGRHVAGVAAEEAKNVAGEARAQVQGLMQQAGQELDSQGRQQKDRLAGTIRSFSDDLETMASQGSGGMAAQVARDVAGRARSLSTHLEQRDPRELLDDVRDFARRKPGTFLLGALAAGVVAGRLTRGAKDAHDDGTASGAGAVQVEPQGRPATPPGAGLPVTGAAPDATGWPGEPIPAGGAVGQGQTPIDPAEPGGRI